ncbi:phosphate transporter PHO1 [Acrasis kona]|uniref:Phosphate transporter PHO1 n=1 Tax=Acrasis kona TaxID=1008807 RepID=A0AAW2YJ27_9EUKA
MTFAQYFDYHSSLYPKWKDKYVSYKELREDLHTIRRLAKEDRNSFEASETTNLLSGLSPVEAKTSYDDFHGTVQHFTHHFSQDVEEVHAFYAEMLEKYEHELDSIVENVYEREESGLSFAMGDKTLLQKRLITLYRQMEFLYSYLHMNRIAVRELRDRFEDALHIQKYIERVRSFTDSGSFSSVGIKTVMERAESVFASLFTGNDHQRALYAMRQPNTRYSHGDTFKLAFNTGIIFTVTICVIIAWFIHPSVTSSKLSDVFFDAFPIFRGQLLYIIYVWMWGLNLYVWSRNRINHVYIFEFDPNNNLDHIRVFKSASVVSVVWVVSFLLYLIALKTDYINANYIPLVMSIILVGVIVLPLHAFHLNARWTLLKTLINLFLTPFGQIRFRETFAADILTSMVIAITDTMYMFCYFFSNAWNKPHEDNKCTVFNQYAGPCLTCLPYVWRLLQSLKKYYDTKAKSHLMNAGKYTSALTVIVFNTIHTNVEGTNNWATFRYLWLVCVVFTSLYAFMWDTVMDWGLVTFVPGKVVKTPTITAKSVETPALTEEIVYRVKKEGLMRKITKKLFSRFKFREKLFFPIWYYYVGTLFNFVARFAWAGTISTFVSQEKVFLKIIFGSVELFRRCNWSCFRLEWAMISNSDQYRKQRTVPFLPPIETMGLDEKDESDARHALEHNL